MIFKVHSIHDFKVGQAMKYFFFELLCVKPSLFIICLLLKVAFIQKVLVNLSFPQTDEPYYFPELEF